MLHTALEEGKLVFHFQGPLDSATCQELEAEILAKVRAAQSLVVFDLQGVEYVASTFLRLCLVISWLTSTPW
jgi:anti-anti-sigma regulatory factor